MKTLSHTVTFKNTTALQVYELLINEKHHMALTGEHASITRQVGGKFKVYGDYFTGVNVELLSPRKIIQKWRAADWEDKHHFSTCIFEIDQNGNDVVLNFTQQDIPEKNYKGVKQDWNDRYWEKMKEYIQFLNRN